LAMKKLQNFYFQNIHENKSASVKAVLNPNLRPFSFELRKN